MALFRLRLTVESNKPATARISNVDQEKCRLSQYGRHYLRNVGPWHFRAILIDGQLLWDGREPNQDNSSLNIMSSNH